MNGNKKKRKLTAIPLLGGRVLLVCFSILMAIPLFAQNQIQVSGTVKDAEGEAVIGASVSVVGRNTGTVTDINGSFNVSAPSNGTLEISYVGFVSQRIAINGRASLPAIVMEESTTGLDELVVVGYGTVKKRDLTGAVTSVKSEDITLRPGPNPIESLQGRVAGLDITRTSGQAGAGITMQLRGTRSFRASGTPLVLIDGLPGDYATLNPNDIESIEVLKDASSTAVYGSAGANGVIIISTKKGDVGRVNVNFNAYYGYNGWSKVPEMRTGDDYLKTKRDAYGWVWDAGASQWTKTGAIWQSPADDITIFGSHRWDIFNEREFVDWVDLFLQKSAYIQNYSLSVSGGNEKTRGYISFNLTDELGQLRGDDYKRYSTNMRIEHNPYKWLSVGSNLQGSYVISNNATTKLENALVTDPLVKIYNEDGTLNKDLGNNVSNLLFDYQPGVYENVSNNFRVNVNPYIEIKPVKGLSVLSRIGIAFNYANTYRFDGKGSVAWTYSNSEIIESSIRQNRRYGYQWENILTYNFKPFNDDHDFTFTGVTSWADNQVMNTLMEQTNITNNNFKWYNMQGDVNTTATTSYSMTKAMGYVARLNYSYLGKYILQAAVRRDGSSVLYKDHRWDTFPTVSGAWRISDEKFMDFSKNWLNSLKLRLSWGVTGTANINAYSSVNSLESLNLSLGAITVPMFRNSRELTNPYLGWEKSTSTNIGLDAILLKNRIDLTLDYYYTKTDGVIWNVALPGIYGTYTPGDNYYQTYMNLCQTQNNGFEMTLNTRNIVTKDFRWSSNLVFTAYKEKILKLTGGTNDYISNGGYYLIIGQPIRTYYGSKLDGVWQIGQEKDAAVFSKRPGDLKINTPGLQRLGEGVYVKTAEDGTQAYYYTDLVEAQRYNSSLTDARQLYTYGPDDYQIMGHNTPKWTLGFQNEFRYKDFDLTVYAYMRWGQMISYVMTGWYQPNAFATNASPSRTIPKHFNYWTPENPSNDFPVMNYLETSSTMTGSGSLSRVDGSFFKVKNITLGYTLPKTLSRKLSMDKFRVYGTVANPLIAAKSHILKEYDPEMGGGIEYPLTRQVVIGLNVTF